MSLQAISMTCLMLVSGQVTDDIIFTNQRGHKIPMQIEPGRQAEIQQVILYRSTDQGKSWHEAGRIRPDQDGFRFNAEADGYYWFQRAVLNREGKQEPANITNLPPMLKMVIDTVWPQVRIASAERVNGDLVVKWEIQESYPDKDAFKLEYHADDQPADLWQPIQANPGPAGSATVRLTSGSPVTVRLTFKDLAGNQSVDQKPVAGVNGVMPIAFNTSSGGNAVAPVVPSVPPVVPNTSKIQVPPPPPQPVKVTPPPPPPVQPVMATVEKMNVPPHQWQGPASQGSQGMAGSAVGQVVARSDGQVPQNPAAAGPTSSGRMPALQIVNDREVLLEYELSKVGPSGIKTVELWLSRDGGKTWGGQPYAVDDEARKSTSGDKYQRTLELPGDGVYGLYMVVRNSVGLGKPAPKSGDVPEMLIEVDTTLPVANLWAPLPVEGQRNVVLLKWTAEDKNLADTPITLEYAEKQDGPWHVIGTPNLPNSGSYQWKLPTQIPAYVFLRLRARDTAGNEGVAQTTQPQLVDLSVPEGTLHLVRPAGRRGELKSFFDHPSRSDSARSSSKLCRTSSPSGALRCW